jgi:Ca-activated chloride channel family protein
VRFLHPGFAWWLLALAVAAMGVRVARLRGLGLATTSPWVFEPAYRASLLRRLPAAAFLAGLLLLGCALMDPVLPLAETEVRSQGLDIVIALDLSSSMEAPMGPVSPAAVEAHAVPARGARAVRRPVRTRLDATKDAIKAFVGRRIDDRIGMVVFSDNAYVISPLTFDHRYLDRYIDMVDNQILRGEGMTAIGEGLALSNQLLARQAAVPGRRNKVAIVFTDGENNTGRDPQEALAESDASGVRVHLIGVDLEEEIKKKPQVQALLHAVERYGGRYFDADTARGLNVASREIDSIEKGVLVRQTHEHDAPVFQWFAVPSLICLAIGFGLRAVPMFIDQT